VLVHCEVTTLGNLCHQVVLAAAAAAVVVILVSSSVMFMLMLAGLLEFMPHMTAMVENRVSSELYMS